MKNFLFLCLLLAGCQPKDKQQSSVTINGKAYADSVSVDSAGNRIRVKSNSSGSNVSVSGSGNKIDIKSQIHISSA